MKTNLYIYFSRYFFIFLVIHISLYKTPIYAQLPDDFVGYPYFKEAKKLFDAGEYQQVLMYGKLLMNLLKNSDKKEQQLIVCAGIGAVYSYLTEFDSAKTYLRKAEYGAKKYLGETNSALVKIYFFHSLPLRRNAKNR